MIGAMLTPQAFASKLEPRFTISSIASVGPSVSERCKAVQPSRCRHAQRRRRRRGWHTTGHWWRRGHWRDNRKQRRRCSKPAQRTHAAVGVKRSVDRSARKFSARHYSTGGPTVAIAGETHAAGDWPWLRTLMQSSTAVSPRSKIRTARSIFGSASVGRGCGRG